MLPLSVRARVSRSLRTHAADLQGGHFSHWCSFSEPSSSHQPTIASRGEGRGAHPRSRRVAALEGETAAAAAECIESTAEPEPRDLVS
jgi:hypothetical protein